MSNENKPLSEDIETIRNNAEHNDAEAQWKLGQCYFNGDGVEKNSDEAVKWFQKAADQGLVEAQYRLGLHYRVNEDYKESAKWLKKAAKQGHANAQFGLFLAFVNGKGVKRNCEVAAKWLVEAAEQGVEEAIEILDRYDDDSDEV